jgi:hypothetical protein
MKLGVLKKFIPQFIWRKIEKNPDQRLREVVFNRELESKIFYC